jgi:hypothetical protein
MDVIFSSIYVAEGKICSVTLLIGGPPSVVVCEAGILYSRDTRTRVSDEVMVEGVARK